MATPYDKIVDLIRKLDLDDDGIDMNRKIKSIEEDFCNIVSDEDMLFESIEYINQKVLTDRDASIKFAMLFSSKNFDSLSMNKSKVCYTMIQVLENNFLNAEKLRNEDRNMFFNSIALLGEYYHGVRLARGYPIKVLGKALIDLLKKEIEIGDDVKCKEIDIPLAKLILSQVTLNGTIFAEHIKDDLDRLLHVIRLNLIESNSNAPIVKALLLMALDLHNSNFTSLKPELEDMYKKYLIDSENENGVVEQEEAQVETNQTKESETSCEEEQEEENIEIHSSTNGVKLCWNEQTSDVGENKYDEDDNVQVETASVKTEEEPASPAESNDNESQKYETNEKIGNRQYGYDDDRHSVRSEGGTSRFYDINERMKHRQRHNNEDNSHYHHDDRGYNSYDRNRDRGRYNRNWDNYNRGHNNYRRQNNDYRRRDGNDYRGDNNYRDDFSDNHEHRPNQRHQNMNNRFSRNHDDYQRDNNQYRNRYNYHNGPHGGGDPHDSRGGPHNDTRNRPHNGFNNDYRHYDKQNRNYPPRDNSYNRNQNQNRQQPRNYGNYRSNRYGSQNSLTSDSGTWEPRDRKNLPPRRLSQEDIQNDDREIQNRRDENWKDDNPDDELTKNARRTADYMKYLSQQ